MEKVKISFGVPIAVGRIVEIVWPEMGGGKLEPIVKDVESGIVYAPSWACTDGELQPRRPMRTLLGRVRACTIVAYPQSDSMDTITFLTVEPEASPYR